MDVEGRGMERDGLDEFPLGTLSFSVGEDFLCCLILCQIIVDMEELAAMTGDPGLLPHVGNSLFRFIFLTFFFSKKTRNSRDLMGQKAIFRLLRWLRWVEE
jgi:hypothetical protein